MSIARGRPTRRERLRATVHAALHRWRTRGEADRSAGEDEEEIQFHLEMAARQHEARGLTPEQARAAARREFGALDAVREELREERGLPWLEVAGRDLRVALRTLRRSPAFAATALAVIALGIGGVTAIVPLVDAVLLEPLPYPQPERLVALWESAPERGWDQANVSPANLLDWQTDVEAFAGIAGHGWVGGWALGGLGGPAERVTGIEVTGGFFGVLGVPLALGRDFTARESWAGEPVVILSDGLWRRRFAADPAVVGRRVTLDGVQRTVVGVAPRDFAFPQAGLDAWVPFGWSPSFRDAEWFRRAHFVKAFARLAPGATPERAAEELAAAAARLADRYPATNAGYGAGLTPLRDAVVGESRQRLLVLLGAVLLLLLVACANVASLLLARATVRGRELAVRRALGASRPRLVRQLLTESLVLAGAGGALGTLLGLAGSALLVRLAGDTLPRASEVGLDASVLGLALLAMLVTGLVFGIGPGLRAARVPPAAALRAEGRAATGDRELLRSRGTLMLAEVAIAVVLLAGAGLALRSFGALAAVDPGFQPDGRLAASYQLPPARYPENHQVLDVHRRLLERVEALPGVASAAIATSLPLEGLQWTSDFLVDGRPPSEKGVEFARRIVTAGYFETLGVPLLAGSGFPADVGAESPPVVVVNAAFARQLLPGRSPIGQRVAIETDGVQPPLWRTVIGVVADEKLEALGDGAKMEMFVPLGQELLGEPGMAARSVTLVVRGAAGEPLALAPTLRAAVAEVDPEVPLYDVRTLAAMLAAATARERLLMVLLGLFAAVALALAVVGVYGLVVFAVAQRRREIGIRMALGAGHRDVLHAVAGRALALGGAGIAIGLVVAALAARALRGLLYGVEPADPATLAASGALLGLAVAVAAWLPARRATRQDPLATLRSD